MHPYGYIQIVGRVASNRSGSFHPTVRTNSVLSQKAFVLQTSGLMIFRGRYLSSVIARIFPVGRGIPDAPRGFTRRVDLRAAVFRRGAHCASVSNKPGRLKDDPYNGRPIAAPTAYFHQKKPPTVFVGELCLTYCVLIYGIHLLRCDIQKLKVGVFFFCPLQDPATVEQEHRPLPRICYAHNIA